ncbi:MAG: hypothetical protein A3C07_00320 [Candidatus Sungbacteria bacterium RIFCSPHIGHO2_02_FULL_47_11]|uniref:Uncharacterized protein n=1 Tax=Candidatus Sungbacteria bacterium RIFCSPHIGHO2_02_FULL_47_11 TaxID=1802270 RepID=A0A1G2KJZ9_9BACT|nr:MAG: hypothetical protein A3C07_00320 [Candidatus Sungbacteria bacterium RIFCSPHIGHO2_02_FULL_47_11]
MGGIGSGRHTKVDNQKVVDLRLEHSDYSCAKIGREIGLARERVRQILKKAGRFTRVSCYCYFCGQAFRQKELRATSVIVKRGNGRIGKRIFQCISCARRRKKERWVTLECEVCHKKFERRRSKVQQAIKLGYRHTRCSDRCKGLWLKLNSKGHPPPQIPPRL